MNIMFLVVILIIVWVMAYKMKWINLENLERIAEVFDPQYYIAKPVNIRVYSELDSEQFLIPADKAYVDAPAKYTKVEVNAPLEELNNGNLDIAIVRRTGHVGDRKNIGFVGNVIDSNLMLLCPNEIPVQDFSDLAQLVNPVIHTNNNEAEQMITDIMEMYPEFKVSTTRSMSTPSIAVYAFLMIHPSTVIANLVRDRPMHLVTINRVNNGDYSVLDNEKRFFNKHLHYEKASFDMRLTGVKHYPGLSLRGQLLYYPTIKYKYTMFAHTEFSADAIKRILTALIDKKILPLTDIAYEPEKLVQTHPGARAVYVARKIYTDKPLPDIWQGF